MPTFGINNFSGSKVSQRSNSKKKDNDDDEFDNLLDSVIGKGEAVEEDEPSDVDFVDKILAEPDRGRRRPESEKPPAKKRISKHASMVGITPNALPGSAQKDKLEEKKRALFGFSGSSEGRVEKLNFGARSQIYPDDGERGIDHNQTNSSRGNKIAGNTSVIDSSPIGVIATSNSRRLAKRKTPSMGGGSSLPRPTNSQAKMTNSGQNKPEERFERNVESPPNFENNTGSTKKPPRPGNQSHPYFINQEDDDDDEFARDEEGLDVLDILDQPDSNKNKSHPSITPKKNTKFQAENLNDDEEDIFSGEGGGYIPSTLSRNRPEDSKSRVKSDISEEATPISRGRRKMIGGIQRDSKDSFSPPDATENNYLSNRNQNLAKPSAQQLNLGNKGIKSSIGVIPVNKSKKSSLKDAREKSVPLDDLTREKLELEESREQTLAMEKRMKQEIENLKFENKKEIMNLESQYNKMLENHNREIKKLSDDMYLSIKQERDKLEMINKTEIENKRKQHEIELAKQKDIYADQNSVFENQLKQQIELNKMLEQVKTSSTNIESTLSHLSEDKTRGLQFQIEECEKRERDLAEKLRNIEYETNETEKRILNSEKEIQAFKVKIEVIKQEQGKEINLNQESLRQEEIHYKRVVDETELKQQESEISLQRISREIQEKQQEYDDKISAIELERKIVISERQNLFEMIQMEKSNQERKISDLELLDNEITQEELDYEQRKAEFNQRENEINDKYNQLKTRVDVFEDEKGRFEDEAMKVHQYSLMVQQESERIANFKENFDSMK